MESKTGGSVVAQAKGQLRQAGEPAFPNGTVSGWVDAGDGVSGSARPEGITAPTKRGSNNTVPLPGHDLPELGVGAGAPLCARVS